MINNIQGWAVSLSKKNNLLKIISSRLFGVRRIFSIQEGKLGINQSRIDKNRLAMKK